MNDPDYRDKKSSSNDPDYGDKKSSSNDPDYEDKKSSRIIQITEKRTHLG